MFAADLLAGKVALVTGSTAGMGARTAEQLAQAGAAHVFINGRSAEAGAVMLDQLSKASLGCRFEFVAADYNTTHGVNTLFERTAAAGGLDIFVHTCMPEGVSLKPFVQTNRADWEKFAQGLFFSLLECCSRAVPQMIGRGGGAIVSFASDAAKIATPGETVSGACLAANVMFVRTLALELARNQIRVNAVTPSITRGTRTYDRMMADEFTRKLFAKAEGRARLGVASAENVAPTAVFLASPLASHLTGQVISVNGGISAA